MSEQGLHLDGFLRSQQGLIETEIGFLLLTFIVYYLIRWLIKNGDFGDDELSALAVLRKVFYFVVIASLAFTLFAVLGTASANRIPRSDVDKSGVYEQMKSHG